jgi:hypothetical protein
MEKKLKSSVKEYEKNPDEKFRNVSQPDSESNVGKEEVTQVSQGEAVACNPPKINRGLKFEKKLCNLQKQVVKYYAALGKCRNQQQCFMKHFTISFLIYDV